MGTFSHCHTSVSFWQYSRRHLTRVVIQSLFSCSVAGSAPKRRLHNVKLRRGFKGTQVNNQSFSFGFYFFSLRVWSSVDSIFSL